MKRFLTYALCVILVLGMIPASIISAFAQGKGVAKDETQNQSIDNALNQYIPETIVVDGNIDDLGWKEWITVDSASGVWNNATVSENQKGFSYTYSIRRDHEYLYVAVNFSDDVAHDFNVYYSADNGATVTTVSFNAENKTVGENQVKLASNGGIVEFSYALGEDAAAAELSCYVSATFNGNKLFYPAIYPEDVDNYTNWQWDAAVSIKSTETESLPDYVNVDGMFNEAYWSQLTNFHQGLDDKKNGYQYSQGEYDLLSFENIQYSNYYYTTSGSTATSNASVKNNLRFKIDMRMDKNAIYGAAIVYSYHETDDTLGFRVFVHNGNDKYKFQIWYNNTPESGQAKNSFTLYKNGNAVASELSSTTSAAGALGYGCLFRIEFRIALEDIGGVNGVKQVTASAAAWHGTNVASTGAYTHSATNANTENAAVSYTFDVAESKKIDLSNDIGINGEIEVSVYKALLGYDDTVQGLKRADGKGGSDSGDVKQYAFTIHADYENVYGAALIEMKDGQQWDKQGHNSVAYDYELFCLWIKSNYDESFKNVNSGTSSKVDTSYSHVIKFYLDASGNVCARLIKVTGLNATSTNAVTTASIASVLGEGCTEALLKEVEAKIVKVSDLRKENGESPDKNDERYAIEFKVPRYVLELDYDHVVKYTPPVNKQEGFIYPEDNSEGDEAGKKGYGEAAIRYFVSMESYENGSQGIVGPVVDTDDGNFHPDDWLSHSSTLLYNSITPQVVTDGVFSEKVWTEGASFVNVDYSNSAVTNETDKKLAYKYKLVLGKEYLYGAAVINSAEEGTQFAIWLKPEGYENKDYRFVIRKDNFHGWQKNAGNIYIYNGYNNDIESDYLKYKVTTLNGNTYFEFKLDLDLFLTRIDNTGKTGIDYEWPEFECFVAAETQEGNDDAQKQMLHPAPSNVLKGDETAYANVGSSWGDALIANAVKNIAKLQHIAPEVIKIDGNLNDNGWDPNGWIEVSNDANATLQEGYEDTYIFQHNNPFTFKYQIRHDGEYLYVAALFDMEDEYTTHDSTKTEKGGNKPQFRIWINPKKEDGTVYKAFKYLYDVTAGNATNKIILPQVEGVTAPTNLTGVTYTAGSSTVKKPNSVDVDTGKVNTDTLTTNGTIKYDGVIVRAAENVMPDFPNGGAAHPVTGDTLVYDLLYGESEFYGYTDIVQENENNGTTGEDWYAKVDNESYTIGNQHAIICSGDGKSISSVEQGKTGTNKNAIVEFKVKMSEFDEGYGFEYRIDAVIQGYYDKNSTNMGAKTDDGTLSSIAYSLHSPVLYTEPGSAYNYWGQNFPYWCWYNGFDFADIEDSARLRNNTTPVVSLGAKICDEYYDAEYDDYTGAIRFGARYEEKYIRYLAGMDDGTYWDVKDMGIVIYPADYLEGELTLETEGALYYPADNIVNWQKGTDGWSNFADYKNFVFYITIWGLVSDAQKNMDFAFRGYMTFYEGSYDAGDITIGFRDGMNAETFYGDVLVRNFNEVKTVAGTENLPGDYDGSQPPVEDQGGKN